MTYILRQLSGLGQITHTCIYIIHVCTLYMYAYLGASWYKDTYASPGHPGTSRDSPWHSWTYYLGYVNRCRAARHTQDWLGSISLKQLSAVCLVSSVHTLFSCKYTQRAHHRIFWWGEWCLWALPQHHAWVWDYMIFKFSVGKIEAVVGGGNSRASPPYETLQMYMYILTMILC